MDFLYLAVAIDDHSRKLVGWTMPVRMVEDLVIDALKQIIGHENSPDAGLVFHSDQGTQHISYASQKALTSYILEQLVVKKSCARTVLNILNCTTIQKEYIHTLAI